MFFFGGFNSIIPHLIYLSLIWVFMIIGFRGKIAEGWRFLNKQEFTDENIALKSSDHQNTAFYQIPAEHKPDKAATAVSFYDSSLPPAPEISTYVPLKCITFTSVTGNSCMFRGPPEHRS